LEINRALGAPRILSTIASLLSGGFRLLTRPFMFSMEVKTTTVGTVCCIPITYSTGTVGRKNALCYALDDIIVLSQG
jgi:hypothetical protein